MKWEYRIETIYVLQDSPSALRETEHKMNRFGEDGWEAVSVWDEGGIYGYVLFKRPKSK